MLIAPPKSRTGPLSFKRSAKQFNLNSLRSKLLTKYSSNTYMSFYRTKENNYHNWKIGMKMSFLEVLEMTATEPFSFRQAKTRPGQQG